MLVEKQILLQHFFLGMPLYDLDFYLRKSLIKVEKHLPGKYIFYHNTPCEELYIVLEGSIEIERIDKNMHFRLTEQHDNLNDIDSDKLFGVHPYHNFNLRTTSLCTILHVKKEIVRDILLKNSVFRLNFINKIASISQKRERLLHTRIPTELHQRFAFFLQQQSYRIDGPHTLYITHTNLGHLLSTTDRTISQMLQKLKEHKLLNYSRGKIHFQQLERYIDFCATNTPL